MPTMTFAASAEVVRYLGAIPILVDCDPMHPQHGSRGRRAEARRTSRRAVSRRRSPARPRVVGIIPVHVGGWMMDTDAVDALASADGLWVVEDAAHAFPAAWRRGAGAPWQRCGEKTAAVSCFSFYANKTITTGEGGMAITEDADLARRMRMMSLHGLSQDAWDRYSGGRSWDYRIVAPGYKYNLTDVAAALGIQQLARAEAHAPRARGDRPALPRGLRRSRRARAARRGADRIHSWHLFPDPAAARSARASTATPSWTSSRTRASGCSVHWRPLHLHPYYEETFGWRPEDLPGRDGGLGASDQPSALSRECGRRRSRTSSRPCGASAPRHARLPPGALAGVRR